ncbi:MAG: hypothetical protein ACR2L1_05470 [Pyrinomonadaceae bacterium]
MELDENAKKAARELGEAINAAVAESFRIAEAIDRLRELGCEPNLTLKLEIGLHQVSPGVDDAILDKTKLELTDEDLKTLQKMKIRFE